jgi:hypothetical protein
MNDAPGFVHGFSRTSMPRWSTWRGDAVRLYKEFRPESQPAPAKAKASKVKTVREPENDDGDESELADWAYLDRVRGLRVVLLGGEVREERRVALEAAFQLGSLEWVPTDRPRLLASLAERASRGTLDFILATKFVRHKETEAIEKASTTPLLALRHGYGVTAVRQAFEEYFSRSEVKSSGRALRSG